MSWKGHSRIPGIPVIVDLPAPSAAAVGARSHELQVLQRTIQTCRRCVDGGYLVRADPVAGYRGRASDRVMLVGQAPGRVAVERGLPFSGPGGRVLQSWLVRAGFAADDFRQQVYLTSLTKCDPGRNPHGGDRKPSPAELALCRPFLLRELALVRPRIILLVGGMAIEAFLGKCRLEDVVGSGVTRGEVHLLPLPHPSGVSRWLNDAGHQLLLEQALGQLSSWRAALAEERNARASAAEHDPLVGERSATAGNAPSVFS